MADVQLDTPVGAYGIPAGLMFDSRPVAAYMRLSPLAPIAAAWWETVPVVDVELPSMPAGVSRDGSRWALPDGALFASPDAVTGLVTGQQGVNEGYVRELAAVLGRAGDPPWPPLRVTRIDRGLWVTDGNHRAAAAVLAGRVAHPARVVTIETLADCPCGWTGATGQWLRHPCTVVTVH